MGFRTVVMLSNDRCNEWEKDPELGRKIMIGMNHTHTREYGDHADLGYGRVVECTHADTTTVALLDGYTSFKALGYDYWRHGRTQEQMELAALKDAADRLGFRLVQKTSK